MLKDDARESGKAFLLNHAISELLPPDAKGRRFSNSDPVTGQAGWFDLRVSVRPCEARDVPVAEPVLPGLKPPPGLAPAPERLSFGAQFRRLRAALP
jgi:hypothetical protein